MRKRYFILRDGEFLLTGTGKAKRFKNIRNAISYLSKGGVKQEEIEKKFSIVSY